MKNSKIYLAETKYIKKSLIFIAIGKQDISVYQNICWDMFQEALKMAERLGCSYGFV